MRGVRAVSSVVARLGSGGASRVGNTAPGRAFSDDVLIAGCFSAIVHIAWGLPHCPRRQRSLRWRVSASMCLIRRLSTLTRAVGAFGCAYSCSCSASWRGTQRYITALRDGVGGFAEFAAAACLVFRVMLEGVAIESGCSDSPPIPTGRPYQSTQQLRM